MFAKIVGYLAVAGMTIAGVVMDQESARVILLLGIIGIFLVAKFDRF